MLYLKYLEFIIQETADIYLSRFVAYFRDHTNCDECSEMMIGILYSAV